MSEYKASIRWQRNEQPFTDNKYSRAHTWAFDGGVTIPASSSPHVVPVPYSDANAVDPEETLVAALSSCHMLSFLYIVAKRGFRVDSYTDNASGILAKDESGRLAVTSVTLHPNVTFSGGQIPTNDELDALHHEAHDACFIANSVKTDVRCQPIYPGQLVPRL